MTRKNKTMRAHLIGTCGKGMSGLAILLKESGWQVTGSDSGFYDPVASMLKKNGIKFSSSYSPSNIPKNADMIVIGKHAALTEKENIEVRAAFSSGIKVVSLSEALGGISEGFENTVVAGSFGKSTITALIAWCLEQAGKNPSYFIGAVPMGFKNNAHLGESVDFIIEGDEYPASNWDSTSKFLHLHPQNVILTSGEHDHINIFSKESDYLRPYKKLVEIIPEDGLLVASNEAKNVAKLIKKARCKVITYGFTKRSTWHPENIKYGLKTSFDLYRGKAKIARLETTLLGNHNIENIVGVSAFLLEKNIISVKRLELGVKNFKGLSGRLDLKNPGSSIPVYEGFGSSYSKAKSIFDALALHFPKKKLITIFEPHTFSWRNKKQKSWYKNIFNTSEHVIILPPPTHGANTHEQMSFEEIIKTAKKYHSSVHPASTEKEALNIFKKLVKKDSLVVLVSSGPLLGLTKTLPKALKKN